jgi:elongation factor G
MNTYPAKNIINVAMAGHSGAGKTSLAEAMLYLAGASDRRGKVGEGNTVCDSDPEEIRRKTSVSTAVAPFEWKNKKINLLDTPGLFDFQGGLYEAARAAESVVIVLAGKSGVSVGTEKAFAAAEKRGLSKIFFVNGLCDEGSDFYKVFEDLKASFGPSVCPIVVPYFEDGKADKYINMLEYKAYDYSGGKPVQVDMPNMGARLEGLRTAIYEAVAETSDELFEKYFSGEEFTPEEVIVGVSQGVKSGTISPVFCGDAMLMRGMEQFMDGLCWLAPSAADKGAEIGVDVDGNPVEIAVKEDAATAAIVFKTVADPFIGKLSYVKVLSGKISTETPLINMRTGNTERVGKTVMMCGKKQEDVKAITAGDIGAIPKLAGVNTGDTLCAPARKVTLDGIAYPTPEMRMAIVPKNKGDEDKVAQGIMRLAEEDPTIRFENNAETKEMVISGMGEQHLDVIVSKLKTKFGVDVTLRSPRVPYRETIRKTVSVQGRHKKQTGGHGQFGDVWIQFEPVEGEGIEFAENVFGGSVPKNFFPAVEKGVRLAAENDTKVVVEEGIVGQEVECAVLGNRGKSVASPVGEIGAGAEFYDYDDKYKNGVAQLFIPARLSEDVAEEVRKTAVRAYNLLGCDGLSRVDFFVTEKEHKVILNEINTLPGFTSISMYPKLWENAGTPYSELLEKLIDCAFTRAD